MDTKNPTRAQHTGSTTGLSYSVDEISRLKLQNDLILQAAGEGIYGLNCEGLTTFVNQAAANMLGWEVGELVGQPMHSLLTHNTSDCSTTPEHQCPIYTTVLTGKVSHVNEESFCRKDGSTIPVEFTSTPIYDNNELTGAVVVFRDISRRKQTERELQHAFSQVEQMKQRLEAENTYLQEEIRFAHDFKHIVGQSHAIKHMLNQIELVAPTLANVLISGESGTGKELIARAIHERSDRRDRPLIRVNCAAIPRELFESEFFGHIRGSFTGAIKDRDGRFALANGGTIFLDEVGEIPLELQGKLLRVLQEGQFEKVGEEKTRSVDVRIIAATNRKLKHEVAKRRFREDLYFRLNVFPIEAVPLRERIQDIPLLTQHFIKHFSQRLNRQEPRLSKINVKQLQGYPWRGNVRELQNVIERAIIVSKNNRLSFKLLTESSHQETTEHTMQHAETAVGDAPYDETERLERDRQNILTALKITHGKVSGTQGAATLLGIKPTTLASRMKTLGIK